MVGIGYGDDVDRVKQVILGALHDIDGVLDDPKPDVKVGDLAASSVNLLIRWWITPAERTEEIDSRDEVLSIVKRELLANGIDLPYETHTVLFHDQTDETDGDRRHQREGWPPGEALRNRSQSLAPSSEHAGRRTRATVDPIGKIFSDQQRKGKETDYEYTRRFSGYRNLEGVLSRRECGQQLAQSRTFGRDPIERR